MIKTLHTGGAVGSDYHWSKKAYDFGLEVYIHSFKEHHKNCTGFGNISINSDKVLHSYLERLKEVSKFIKRTLPKNDYILNLLLRDIKIADKSDAVLAIGTMQDGWITGGTAYTVTRAYLDGKPIYFYDQLLKQWVLLELNNSIVNSIPDLENLPENVAGVGTREINSSGVNAIEFLFTKKVSKPVKEENTTHLLDLHTSL